MDFRATKNSGNGNGSSDFVCTGAVEVSLLGILPVELSSFKARQDHRNHVYLEWTTEAELNNDYFLVERSKDGRNFEPIGFVGGAGTTDNPQTYQHIDKAPHPGQNFYRLKQVDFDGTHQYSDLVTVKVYYGNELFVKPTLAKDEITVIAGEGTRLGGWLTIYDLSGIIVYSEKLTDEIEVKTIDVSTFFNGYYLVQVNNGEELLTKRFVKMSY